MISMIAAESENHVIGKNNQLVWKLPTDTAYFKKTTIHHTIIMGRKTFDSIERALPKRRNIVISRNSELKIPNVEVYSSLLKAIEVCNPKEENFIVGGGELYKEGLAYADKIYLTKVHMHIEGDSYFPELDPKIWKLTYKDERKADAENSVDFTFQIFEKHK